MIHSRSLLLAPLCLLSACAAFSNRSADTPVMAHRVDNSMLESISEGERAQVSDARQNADVARDAYAASKVATQRMIDRRKLADHDLDIAQAQADRAEAEVKVAENGTQEDLDRARQHAADTSALVASIRARILLRDRQVDYAKAFENVKQKNNELAQAKVETTKAHAVTHLDVPQAKKVDVEEFERQLRKCQEEVKIAEVRAEAAKNEVTAASASYDESVEAVPASFRADWPREEDEPK